MQGVMVGSMVCDDYIISHNLLGVTRRTGPIIENRDRPFSESTSAWRNYLTLQRMVSYITVPPPTSPEDQLPEMIQRCLRQISCINNSELQHILGNIKNLDCVQGSPKVTKECLNKVKTAIEDITTTVDEIKTRVNKAKADVIEKSTNKFYVALGIILIGAAVALTAFVSVYAFPAVFIAGAKATMVFDWCASILSIGCVYTGLLLGGHQRDIINLTESENDVWNDLSEMFSKLRDFLEEKESANVEIMVQDIEQHLDNLAHTLSESAATTSR